VIAACPYLHGGSHEPSLPPVLYETQSIAHSFSSLPCQKVPTTKCRLSETKGGRRALSSEYEARRRFHAVGIRQLDIFRQAVSPVHEARFQMIGFPFAGIDRLLIGDGTPQRKITRLPSGRNFSGVDFTRQIAIYNPLRPRRRTKAATRGLIPEIPATSQ